MIVVVICLGLLGFFIGSFLYVCVERLEEGWRKIIFDRSACPDCGERLRVKDLVPILSYVFTQGTCRYCKKPISWTYPGVELLTGCAFALIASKHWLLPEAYITDWPAVFQNIYTNYWTILLLFFVSVFILVTIYDLLYREIPDIYTIPAIILALLVMPINPYVTIQEALIGGLIGFTFFFCLIFFSKGKWMGEGDLRVSTLMGILLGWKILLVALFLSFFSGAVVGSWILLTKKPDDHTIAFGPFLSLCSIISLVWGPNILHWYINLISPSTNYLGFL